MLLSTRRRNSSQIIAAASAQAPRARGARQVLRQAVAVVIVTSAASSSRWLRGSARFSFRRRRAREEARDLVGLRRLVGQVGERASCATAVGCRSRCRSTAAWSAVGTVEILPIGLEHRDRVALALDSHLHLRDLLGPVQALVLDRIRIRGRADERRSRRRCCRKRIIAALPCRAARPGLEGGRAARCGGASVRSRGAQLRRARAGVSRRLGLACRDRAFRHRGEARAAASPRGRWRERPRARPVRTARNCFTIRSSSEWNVTTASRPPGAARARRRASARDELAELVVDGDAQRLEARVAGWMPPGLGRTSAGDELGELARRRRCGALRRRSIDGAGDARAHARSSPKWKNMSASSASAARVDEVGGAGARRAPCACRAARRGGTRSRARPRRAASTRRRCRARRRRRRRRSRLRDDSVEVAEAACDELEPALACSTSRRRRRSHRVAVDARRRGAAACGEHARV